MALHYCRRHQRLFSRPCQRWVYVAPATIQAMCGSYALLCATQTEASFLPVLELSCDHCAALLQPLARSNAADAWCKG